MHSVPTIRSGHTLPALILDGIIAYGVIESVTGDRFMQFLKDYVVR